MTTQTPAPPHRCRRRRRRPASTPAAWSLSPGLVATLVFCLVALPTVAVAVVVDQHHVAGLLVIAAYGLVVAVLAAVVVANVIRQRSDLAEPAPFDAATEARVQRLSMILGALHEGLVLQDEHLRIVEFNDAAARLVGFTEQSLGRRPDQLGPWHPLLEDGTRVPFAEHPSVVALRTGTPIRGQVMGIALPDDNVMWIRLDVLPVVGGDGAVEGVITTFSDITEERTAQRALASSEAAVNVAAEALSWQAHHDPLTHLPNRSQLVERLATGLEHARRHRALTALLFIGLDRFKHVNDSIGHEMADRVLVEVADRLRASIRADDMVARLGSDEFVVLAEALADPAEALALADRIRAAIATPVALPAGPVSVTASVGVAFDVDHRPGSVLRDADSALHKAKDRGRDRVEVYDDALRAETVRKVAAEHLLRKALDEDGLRVLYQPIVDLRTGTVVSAEALLRIIGPGDELLAPASFIAVAEETGLIVPVGAGVLDDACDQLTAWRERFGDRAPRNVSVNLSARQITTRSFPSVVERTLDRHGMHPSALTLELTETSLIEAGHAALDTVEDLHDLGVRLAIDDFGTGYSSLSYLKRFPVDIVKIDRSFVAGLGAQQHDTEIVRAVIALGQSLGLTTVAEGVETLEQLHVLQVLGCDHAQGFLFARPLPSIELGEATERIRADHAPQPDGATPRRLRLASER